MTPGRHLATPKTLLVVITREWGEARNRQTSYTAQGNPPTKKHLAPNGNRAEAEKPRAGQHRSKPEGKASKRATHR